MRIQIIAKVAIIVSVGIVGLTALTQDNTIYSCLSRSVAFSEELSSQFLYYSIQSASQTEILRFDFSTNSHKKLDFDFLAQALAFGDGSNAIAYLIKDGDKFAITFINLENDQIFRTNILSSLANATINSFYWLNENEIVLTIISNQQAQRYIINRDGTVVDNFVIQLPAKLKDENIFTVFNENLSYLAYVYVGVDRRYEPIIHFIDLISGNEINYNTPLPMLNSIHAKDIAWSPDNQTFFMLNDKFNWLAYSLKSDDIEQITSVGEHIYIRTRPILASTQATNAIAFQIQSSEDFTDTSISVGLWLDEKLLPTCYETDTEQFNISRHGWDSSGAYFAFAGYDYTENRTNIYVIDTITNKFYNVLSLDTVQSSIRILGWHKE